MTRIFHLLTLSMVVSISFGQVANFSANNTQGCAPLIVQFDANASTGTGMLNYHWDFGNGNTSVGTDQDRPGAVYSTPGTYTVSLQVEDDNGLSSPETMQVTVFDAPTANFEISGQYEGCSPLGVTFVDLSTPANGVINSWIWDFGDGNSSILQNPSHTFFDQGEFDVELIIRDEHNCQGDTTFSTVVRVGYPQNVEFVTATPNNNTLTCTNMLTINFEDQTTYQGTGPYTYSWDFGDGNSSTSQNPSHTFNGFGNYDVTLSITDEFANCVTTLTKTSYVNLIDVVPSFDMTPTTGCVSQGVTFNNTSNTFLGNQIVTWDFGDGNTLTGPATDPNIMSPSHTYGVGIFYPSMSIDVNGGECFENYTSPDPIIVKNNPTVTFEGDTLTSCQAPFEVTFTPVAPEAEMWFWDFGDGNTSTSEIPTHFYNAEGNFDVSLTITDSLGCIGTYTLTDYVNIEAPQPQFTSDIFSNASFPISWDGRDINTIAGGCLPLDINFTDLSTSLTPIIDWSWDFGDGNTNIGSSNPTNTYTTEGEFQVSMTITTVDGCQATYTCDSCAATGSRPEAMIDTTNLPLQQCCVAEFDFVNTTVAGTADYFWYEVSTGDFMGTDETVTNWDYYDEIPVNPNNQTLDFTFYAWNNGCLDTLFYPAFTTLHQPYVAPNMLVDPCIYSDSLRINGPTVLGITDSLSWDFTFNNQTAFNTTNPTFYSPETAGNYDLTVTAWDLTNKYDLSNGDSICSCTITESSYFPGIPIVYDFTSTVDSGCVPLDVQFDGPTENLVAWDWDFANTETSVIENPSTTYDTIGDYNVRLIVTDVAGCTDTIVKTQFIQAIGANVYILPSVTTGCLPFDATFTDTSRTTAPIISRTWDIATGDQFIGNDSIINFSFTDFLPPPALQKEGIDITLTTVDSNGCTNSGIITVYAADPEASFIHEAFPLCEQDSIIFTGINDDSVGIAPFSFDWELDNPGPTQASGITTTKLYEPGNYNIRVMITDSIGCRDTSTFRLINVIAPQPEAIIDVNRTSATCPPIVAVFGDSSSLGRAPITNWLWSFGDGSSSQLQHPTNIYSSENSFDVSLTVTDSLGCTDSTVVPGFVTLTGVVGGFDVYNNVVCESDSATFIAYSPNAANFTWDFGDGNIGTGDTIVHTYSFPSTRYPTLVMQDSSGLCSSTFTDTVTVLELPNITLDEEYEICLNDSVKVGLFLGPTEVATWGNGIIDDSIYVLGAGYHTVEVRNVSSGCFSIDSLLLIENPLPQIASPGNIHVCEGENATAFINTSSSDLRYSWKENETIISNEDTLFSVLVNSLIDYTVIVETIDGCIDSVDLHLSPIPPPIINISDTAICPSFTAAISATPENGNHAEEIYTWYYEDQLLPLVNSSTIHVSDIGKYELNYAVGQCSIDVSFNLSHLSIPKISNHKPRVFCPETESGANISPGTFASYYWHQSGTSDKNYLAPSAGIYYVDIENNDGCFNTDSIEVYEDCPPRVYIGNAFTPNNDGNNDYFLPKGDYIDSFEMFVFNRWGEIIYHTTDIDEPWEGFYQNNEMPEGVYPWLINYTGTHPDYQETTTLEGKVTLIR